MPRLSPEDKIAKKTIRRLERTIKKMGNDNSTEWENIFVEDVKAKIEEYGSAFYDAEKGDITQSLSKLQNFKVAQINKEIQLREKIGMKAARNLVFSKMRHKKSSYSDEGF